MSKILITGASGLIGTRLTEMLTQHGHEVSLLGRRKKTGKIPSFVWDVDSGTMDEQALKDVDAVIHLAGAGVADKRWSAKRKQEILESRIKSTALLARHLGKHQHVKTIVSASAIGYYGFGHETEFTEESGPGNDFLAQVVKAWEEEVDTIKNKRLVKLRIGIVLSEKGGALKEMATPVRWFVGAPLGSGQQYLSWIHLDDLCRMFLKAIEDPGMHGVYNATAPYAITNRELTRAIASAIHKPLLLPNIPALMVRVLVGEMAAIVLNGSIVSSKKIRQAGFEFQFPKLEEALRDLLHKG